MKHLKLVLKIAKLVEVDGLTELVELIGVEKLGELAKMRNSAELLRVEKLMELVKLEELEEKEIDLLLLIKLEPKKLGELRLTNNIVRYKMRL